MCQLFLTCLWDSDYVPSEEEEEYFFFFFKRGSITSLNSWALQLSANITQTELNGALVWDFSVVD